MTALGQKTFQSPAPPPVDVAALVAQYAPVGRRRRRLQWLRRLAMAMAVPAAAAIAVAAIQGLWFDRLVQSDPPAATDTAQVIRMQALQARLQAETGAISVERQKWAAQRGEMAAQRVRLEERNTALNTQLAALEARWQELSGQLNRERRLFAQQRVAKPDRSEASPVTREAERPPVQEATIRTQIVDRELKALAVQRGELARQQSELDVQRQELQALMQRYDEAARAAATPVAGESPAAAVAPATGAAADSSQDPLDSIPESQLLMAGNRAVGEDALGTMRGGLSVGNGPEISFGITRSAALNGIEQFSNSVYVDDLAKLAGGGLDGTAQSVLLQSGGGNIVSADAIDALSSGLGTLIQNTLDSQIIETRTVIDISVGNVGNIVNDLGASEAVRESLSFQRP